MDKDRYIRQGLFDLTNSSISALLPFGAFFLTLLSILDYFVTPEHFSIFLTYRLIASSLVMGLYFIFRFKRNKGQYFQLITIILTTLIPISMVELMILAFGGHQSIYYVGLIVVLIFILGFLPLSTKMTVLVNCLAYGVYIVPILLFDDITNVRTFVNNNMFFLTAIMGSLGWRYYNQNLIIKNLSLEYDLSQDKEQLQQYSTKLVDLVAQRTKELAISEQKYRGLFDYASDGVAVYDRNGIIVNVNRKFFELHGFPVETLIGTSIKLLDAGKDDAEKEERITRILAGESIIYETRHYRKDGTTILFEISAKALDIEGEIYIQAFHRDISDKKRLQEQLFQSQKMESIGMLAGGLAHDFNNVIHAILGHIELLSLNDTLDADARRNLSIIESSSRRASQMISKLLKFARKGAVDVQPVELNSVVRDTTELISKTLSHRSVKVNLELLEGVPYLMGDSIQMEQVVMNLMVNAADSMPDGGTVTVATTAKDFGREAEYIHPLLAPGSYVILRVTDSGSGIPEDIRDKIFDPFFTTKAKEKGTGLGLAMVYGIVKDHKGAVTVESQVGKGTTFEVYIPAYPLNKPVQSSLPDKAGREIGSVLIVDDQGNTLKFVSEALQSFGYEVISEDNALHALQIFKEKADRITLVITDIFMPTMDGRDLVKHFKSIKPAVKVIAMSGYQMESFVRQDIPIDDFIQKPFDSIDLIKKVNKLLQSHKSLLS
jgi:two-component system, cell cycle sensor histidine kinase and response regulator CckA